MEGAARTVPAQFARLPPTEHALLLNRFKFLNLVQRIAAADVAEMIDTVGLEALTFKGTLEKLSLEGFPASGVSRSPHIMGTDTVHGFGSHMKDEIHGKGHLTGRVRGKGARERRFSSPKEEKEFINRLARPRNYRNQFGTDWRRYPQGTSTSEPAHVPGDPSAQSVWHRKKSDVSADLYDNRLRVSNDEDDLYGDNVVIESCDDRLQQHDGGAHNATWKSFRQPDQEGLRDDAIHGGERCNIGESAGGFADAPPSNTVEGISTLGAQKRENINAPSILSKGAWTKNQPGAPGGQFVAFDAASAHTMNSARRNRASFAPKAKPKAAPDVQRVPMEVIRQASLLLADKQVAEPLQQPPPPQIPPSGAQNPTQSNTLSAYGSNFRGSGSQVQVPSSGSLNSKKEVDSSCIVPKRVSDDTLAELTLCVEKMLQDHRKVLEGILKDERPAPDDPPAVVRRSEQGGRGGVADGGINMTREKASVKERKPSPKSTHGVSGSTMGRINDLLEDISDEEDELLLVNRIQRKIGAMDRDIEAIEARGKQVHGSLGENDGDHEGIYDRETSSKNTNRRVAFTDTISSSRRRGRRRGEMPRAIVERIRSFQKENHEYIQYTERLWNTSKVTEQVFAYRLTESLLDDALREVISEVGGILDTYVEGLTHHELQ